MTGISVRKQKEKELIAVIEDLASKKWMEDKAENYVNKFREIYQGEYRHDYSIFFPLLSKIEKNEKKESILILNENLVQLRSYIDRKFCEPVNGAYNKNVRQIVKLLDHLNLESSRLDVNSANKNQIRDLKNQLETTQTKLENAQKKLVKASKKATSMQTELISILSIFSAVILVFFVDTQSITSAMISMQNSSIFRVVLVLSICGLLLFNGLFLLFQFISYLITKNSDRQAKILRFGKPLFYLDLILILLIICDVMVWYLCIYGIEPFNHLYYPVV